MQLSLLNTPNTNTFKDFEMPKSYQAAQNNQNNSMPDKLHLEHHNEPQEKNKFKKIAPLIGTIIGTILPLVIINKVKGKNLDKEVLKNGGMLDKLKEVGEYFEIEDVPRILSTAGGAIAGGLIGGCIVDKNSDDRREKFKEGLFEMTNITVPTLLTAGILKLMHSKNLDKGIGKFAPVLLGLGIGIPAAQKISNTISKTVFKDKGEERKFKPTDLLVHSDDLIEMLVLLKIPFAKKLHIDKLLALIYAKCGYETGTKDARNKSHGHHH